MQTIKVQNPDCFNMIIGHSPTHDTVDSINESLKANYPEIKFGLAFNHADPTQINYVGSDDFLVQLAKINADNVRIKQTFFLFTEKDGIVDVMRVLKNVPEIDKIYCATQNQIEIIVVDRNEQRDIMGLIGDYTTNLNVDDLSN